MKPSAPKKGCPTCNTRRLPVMIRVTSRVYAEWECLECGQMFRTDAATGKFIARTGIKEIEGEATHATA